MTDSQLKALSLLERQDNNWKVVYKNQSCCNYPEKWEVKPNIMNCLTDPEQKMNVIRPYIPNLYNVPTIYFLKQNSM